MYSWLTGGTLVVLLANLQIEDCPEITELSMLLEHVIPEIMQGIQIRRMYGIRQTRKTGSHKPITAKKWPKRDLCHKGTLKCLIMELKL